jgi:hypothetical protein
MFFRGLPIARLHIRSRRGQGELLLDGIEPVIKLVEIADEGVVAAGRTEHGTRVYPWW